MVAKSENFQVSKLRNCPSCHPDSFKLAFTKRYLGKIFRPRQARPPRLFLGEGQEGKSGTAAFPLLPPKKLNTSSPSLPRGSFKFMSLVVKRRISLILKSFILTEMGQAKPRIQDDAIPLVFPLS